MDFGFFELFSGALAVFYALVPSYGLAIILLTLAVRILLLPLSIKQTRSMREMQRIQPEIKRVQAKYKGNRQKMNEELMTLYKEHNVNPFGGCLPLVMQFPVLIGLFYVVRDPLKYMGYVLENDAWRPVEGVSGVMEAIQNSALARGLDTMALEVNKFLGVRLDCSAGGVLASEPVETLAGACPQGLVNALPYLLMVVLMGVTTWYQQRQMMVSRGPAAADDPTARQMQMMGKIMPVMLMFFAYTFPLGVVLYWLTTNVWTIGQQRIVLAAAPPEPPAAGKGAKEAAEAKASGDAKKPNADAKGSAKAPKGASGNGARTGTKPHPSSKKKRRR